MRECPVCGNATPVSNPYCVNCGHASPEAVAAHQEAVATRRFVLTLASRSSPFTLIFIGANAAMFLIEWLAGGMGVMSADHETLLGLGAKNNDLIASAHQYWRLVTCIFLHIGFLHLLFNNYALWIIGQEIERLYGSARFVVLYTATGIVASLSSFWFRPEATSVGASGAIFGLFGVMAVFAFKYRREIPNAIGKSIRSRVLTIIAINLFIGFQLRIMDNSAHLGGLLSGIGLALVVGYKRRDERVTPATWRALRVACLALVFVSLGFAFRNFRDASLSVSNLASTPSSLLKRKLEGYFSHLNGASLSFGQADRLLHRGTRDGTADSTAKARQSNEEGIRKANSAPKLDSEAEDYRRRILDLLVRQRDLIERASQTTDAQSEALVSDAEILRSEFAEVAAAFKAWAPDFLNRQGFTFAESGGGNSR